MSVARLPSHVTSEIINYLPHDSIGYGSTRKPLANFCAAALVCRSWLVPARRNIFRTVTIPVHCREAKNGPAGLAKTLEMIELMSAYVRHVKWDWTHKDEAVNHGGAIVSELYQKLVALSKEHKITHTFDELRILSMHETIPFLLAVLDGAPELAECIDTVTWDWEVPHETTTVARQLWREKGGPELMGRPKSVKNLTLRGATFGPTETPVSSLTKNLPLNSIISLRLEGLKFSSGVELCSFLGCFSYVSDLTEGRISIDKKNIEVPEDELRKMDKVPPLTRLTFQAGSLGHHYKSGADVLLKWFAAQTTPAPVENLTIVDTGESVTLASFCSATLKSLSIVGVNQPLELSAFTSLKRLSLDTEGEESAGSDITETLQTLQSNGLVSLRMDILWPNEDDLAEMHEILDKPRFGKLRELLIRIPEYYDDRDVRETLDAFAGLAGFRFESMGNID